MILSPGNLSSVPSKIKMRERDGGLERVADHVAQIAVALEPLAELRRGAVALRVDEDDHAELLGLRPARMALRIADLLAGDVATDGSPAQAVFLHAFLELLGGEVRVLQRHRGEGDEAVRVCAAHLGELLVL